MGMGRSHESRFVRNKGDLDEVLASLDESIKYGACSYEQRRVMPRYLRQSCQSTPTDQVLVPLLMIPSWNPVSTVTS
jgi:hypothetical protein